MKTKDILNKKFSRWFVLEIICLGKKPKVKVKCDCGTIKIISASSLVTKGKSKSMSCGCYQRERIKECLGLPMEVAAINQYYSIYKSSARIRTYEFKLTKLEFKEYIFKNCYYCNKEPKPRFIHSRNLSLNMNGIDRVDNSKGYINGNCVPCCINCNDKKSNVTIDIMKKALEFLNE